MDGFAEYCDRASDRFAIYFYVQHLDALTHGSCHFIAFMVFKIRTR